VVVLEEVVSACVLTGEIGTKTMTATIMSSAEIAARPVQVFTVPQLLVIARLAHRGIVLLRITNVDESSSAAIM